MRTPSPSPFRGRWLIATLAVLLLAALFLRLGTWQLQRRAERRAANAQLLARLTQPPLSLDGAALDVAAVDLRRATVTGVYDYDQEIVLRNRTYNEFPGVHLITPLRISGSEAAILVDRGWIPYEDAAADRRARFDRPSGAVTVTGILRRSMVRSSFASPADPSLGPDRPRLDAWHRVDIPRIQEQIAYPLLPMYLELERPTTLPSTFPRPDPDISLSEGSHLIYASQWFAFAVIALAGYAFVFHQRAQKGI